MLSRYWSRNENKLLELPVPHLPYDYQTQLPPRLSEVGLPSWANEFGKEGLVPVPEQFIRNDLGPLWEQTDWWNVIFWYLNGTAERCYEQKHEVIHSYSSRLDGWNAVLWEKAWVNRIALFLRRWCARTFQQQEQELFGELPAPEILLTHDVDAVRKTPAILLKQSLFNGYNVFRSLWRRELDTTYSTFIKGINFLTQKADYWRITEILDLEQQHNIRSYFNFYGGNFPGQTLKQQLFDPAYSVLEPRLRDQVKNLIRRGWHIGLHQSFDSWRNSEKMAEERERLEQAAGIPIRSCRQHWLRFSWADTWRAQQQAGFELDMTLGFNDRPGFRNGAALCFSPWSDEERREMQIRAVPMILMDSQLFDYTQFTDADRIEELKKWINEVQSVFGIASVIWHQRTFSDDYNWGGAYQSLLQLLE